MTAAFTLSASSTAAAALALGLFIAPPTLSPTGGSSLVRASVRNATAVPTNDRRSVAGSSVATTYAADIDPRNSQLFGEVSERQTSQVERTVGELRRWMALSADWDGEGSAAPVALSLKSASDFIRLLPETIADAEPMLNANGLAGLFWNENDLYADLEFLGDGRIAYFIQHSNDKHKGQLHFDGEQVPPVLTTLLETSRVGTQNT